MTYSISKLEEFDVVVGRREPIGGKDISYLDVHCQNYVRMASLIGIALSSGKPDDIVVSVHAGPLHVVDTHRFTVPMPVLDPRLVPHNTPLQVGTMLFITGINEVLRVNGMASWDAGLLVIEVRTCFLHCAKALMRSRLWKTEERSEIAVRNEQDLIARSPFLLIASRNIDGHVTLSPRGDPPGGTLVLADDCVALPDRAGNMRYDSFLNLLDDPAISIAWLVPGSPLMLIAAGTAHISAEPELCARMRLGDQVPTVATKVTVTNRQLVHAAALECLWREAPPARGELAKPPRIWADHVNIAAAPSAAAISAEEVEAEIIQDYATRL